MPVISIHYQLKQNFISSITLIIVRLFNMDSSILIARERIEHAGSLTVLTGAGVSAESGIPTFRDRGGIWEKFDPKKVATPEAFAKGPKYVWEWYIMRMKAFKNTEPNPAHSAIALLEKKVPTFTLITQNIDNLHRIAGSQNMIEIHGNIWRTRCLGCGKIRELDAIPESAPPHCSECQGMLRPDVVWFGEELDWNNVVRAQEACKVDVFLIVGTSGEVWPAAGFAHQSKSTGAFVIEVNTQATELSMVADLSLFGKAGEVMSNLVK
jgi:NAD-dependent deacetylase